MGDADASKYQYILDVDDLPGDLAVKDIKKYLDKNYPGVGTFNIIYEPVSIHKNLPVELIGKILKEGVNKETRRVCNREKYINECMEEIHAKDIKKYIYDQQHINKVLIENDDDERIIVHINPEIIINNEYEDIIGNPSIKIEIEENLVQIAEYDMADEFKDVEDKIMLDLISEHKIRNERMSCIECEYRYADNFLVDKYNSIFSSDMDRNVSVMDLKDVIIANCIAYSLNNNIELLYKNLLNMNEFYGRYDIGELRSMRDFLVYKFNEAREIIKRYVMKVTERELILFDGTIFYLLGAEIYEDNPNKLYLPRPIDINI